MSICLGQAGLTRDPHDKDPHRKKQQRAVGEGSEKKGLRRGERRRKPQIDSSQNLRNDFDVLERLMKSSSLSQEESEYALRKITKDSHWKSIPQEERNRILKIFNSVSHQLKERERDEKHD